MGLDDQVKYRLELYLALKVPMVEISKESDKVRGRDKRPCLIKRRLNNEVNNNKILHSQEVCFKIEQNFFYFCFNKTQI